MSFSAFAYALGAAALALGIYTLARALLGRRADDDDHNLSLAVITRLGTLHALILALIFAAEMENYLGILKLVTNEVGAVADTYYGTKRIAADHPQTVEEIQKAIADYVHTVVQHEWALLAREKRLSDRAWSDYTIVDEALLRLELESGYQREIRRQLLEDWDAVSQYRRGREAAALREVPGFFWVLAIAGFVAVVLPYYVFSPRKSHLLILTLFGAFNGLVFHFIIELNQPFDGDGAIEPVAFERLYAEDMATASAAGR